MLEQYQTDRVNLIKDILPYFGDNFVLKGGTALSLYYGLNRYSEDIDLDCMTNNMNFINRLKHHKDFNKWNINIKKDTDTIFRTMIDYGALSHYGDYPLKIEVSGRNRNLLRTKALNYNNIDGVNVYSINELIRMKSIAFSGRDKIRDFYDLGFLLKKYPNHFNKDILFSIRERIFYCGEDELNLLLKDEISKHKLISQEQIYIAETYTQDILEQIELLIEKKNSLANDLKDKEAQDKALAKKTEARKTTPQIKIKF